jgi:medium-chain acyl-[acyl-carrier-protein] hydrolase
VGPLVDALAPLFEAFRDKPFVFYGHSMGAVVGFELAHGIRDRMGVEPAHLIVSGRQPPGVPDSHSPSYNLPEAEFIDWLRRMNGTPKEVLENRQLMEIMLPLLRADFQLCETYECPPRPPLSCPVTALRGVDDPDVQSLDAWCEVTTGRCSIRVFPGDHFFLHTYEKQLLELISRELQRVRPGQYRER